MAAERSRYLQWIFQGVEIAHQESEGHLGKGHLWHAVMEERAGFPAHLLLRETHAVFP